MTQTMKKAKMMMVMNLRTLVVVQMPTSNKMHSTMQRARN